MAKARVLAIHGINTREEDASSWQPEWEQEIAFGMNRAGRTGGVEVDFLAYNRLFDQPEFAIGLRHYREVLGAALSSWRGRRAVVGAEPTDLHGLLNRVSGMVVRWAYFDELRHELRQLVMEQLESGAYDYVVAHSLGSLIAYDTLAYSAPEELNAGLQLITMGSQVGSPLLADRFGGAVAYPVGLKGWVNLYNAEDDVLVTRVPLRHERFVEVDTFFDVRGPLDHAGELYLAQPEGHLPCWGRSRDAKAARAVARSTRPPVRRALIVGVDRYADPSLTLEGCKNDAFAVSATLQESGFEADHIRLLLDERATASNLLERLDWLVDGAVEGDELLFYFSGHGAQLPRYNEADVVDRMDECLVPHDFDWSVERALIDDTFAEFYASLPYGARFLAILDCCHSGGMSRGSGMRVRGLDPPDDILHRSLKWDPVTQMWVPRSFVRAADSGAGEPGSASRGRNEPVRKLGRAMRVRPTDVSTRELAARYGHAGPYFPAIVHACQESEYAYEYKHGPVSYGAFTYAWTATLRRRRDRGIATSVRELVTEVSARLAELGYEQTPGLVGHSSLLDVPLPWTARLDPVVDEAVDLVDEESPAKSGAAVAGPPTPSIAGASTLDPGFRLDAIAAALARVRASSEAALAADSVGKGKGEAKARKAAARAAESEEDALVDELWRIRAEHPDAFAAYVERRALELDDVIAPPPTRGVEQRFDRPLGAARGSRKWSNWIGDNEVRIQNDHWWVPTPTKADRKHRIENLRSHIARAAAAGLEVRPLGAGHSSSSVNQPRQVLIDNTNFDGVEFGPSDLKSRETLVRCEAGIRISALNLALAKHRRRLALPIMGTFDNQTLAGAISTGTHGSNAGIGCIADIVRSIEVMTWIDGRAQLVRIEPRKGPTASAAKAAEAGVDLLVRDDAAFYGAVVSLGCTGFVYSMTLAVRDAFWLEETREFCRWSWLAEKVDGRSRLESMARGSGFFDVSVFPHRLPASAFAGLPGSGPDLACLITRRRELPDMGDGPPRDLPADVLRTFAVVFGTAPIGRFLARRPERLKKIVTDQMRTLGGMPDERGRRERATFTSESRHVLRLGFGETVKATSSELAVSLPRAVAALERVFELAAAGEAKGRWHTAPVGVRFVAPSRHVLTPYHRNAPDPSCTIEVPLFLGTPSRDKMLEGLESALVGAPKYDAVPHWGQRWFDVAKLRAAYPGWSNWSAGVADVYGPRPLFGSKFRDVLGD